MKTLYLTGLMLVSCAAAALAQDSLTLLDPPNTGSANAGGVYTSPYNFSVSNGVTTTTAQLVCDDFLNDIYVGETWNTTVTTLTTLSSSSVAGLMYGGSSKITPPSSAPIYTNIAQDYALDAVLVAELMSLSNLASPAAEGYSFAIWDVFDTSAGDPTGLASADLTSAESIVNAATTGGSVDLSQISISGHALESLTVYTPSGFSSNTGGSSVPQEFLQVSMPEPSYPAVLGLDLLAAAGIITALRRRKPRVN